MKVENVNKMISMVVILIGLILLVIFVIGKIHYDKQLEKEMGSIIKKAMSNPDGVPIEDAVSELADDLSEKSEKVKQVQDSLEESDSELLDSYKCTYDENNWFSVEVKQSNATGRKSALIIGAYENDNIGLMQNNFLLCWSYPYGESWDITAGITVGNTMYSYFAKDGKVIMNTVPLEPLKDIPEEYIDQSSDAKDKIYEFYNGVNEYAR